MIIGSDIKLEVGKIYDQNSRHFEDFKPIFKADKVEPIYTFMVMREATYEEWREELKNREFRFLGKYFPYYYGLSVD